MRMDIVAGSQNDEFYTPNYAIIPIVKYLKEKSIIWCPFDTEDSLFVKILKEKGFKVINTHKEKGEDFFKYSFDNIPDCDYIISNPPYSLKTEVLEILFEWNKPFAMLVGVVGLFESKRRFELFKKNNFEIMYFNKRIAYFKSFGEQIPSINPPFSSVYVCKDILPKQIIFEEVEKNKMKELLSSLEDLENNSQNKLPNELSLEVMENTVNSSRISSDTRKGCGKGFDFIDEKYGLLRLQCGVWTDLKYLSGGANFMKMEYCEECEKYVPEEKGK